MYEHVCKYGLQIYIKDYLSNDVSIRYGIWKKRIKSIIWSYETAKWNATCRLYPDLDFYCNYIEKICMHMWWKFVVDNPIYMEKASAALSILCNVQPKRLQRNFKSDRAGCLLCKELVVDDFRHTFFCPYLNNVIVSFFDSTEAALPLEMRPTYDSLCNRMDKICFLLSGFKLEYNKNWTKCYTCILDKLWNIYKTRAMAIDSL